MRAPYRVVGVAAAAWPTGFRQMLIDILVAVVHTDSFAASRDLPPVPLRVRRDPQSWSKWLEEAFRPWPTRAAHSRSVWKRVVASCRGDLLHLDVTSRATLELAALLHDVGRAIDPADHEPHAFVGARFLDRIGLNDVASLVAHHSGAREEAADRGMTHLDVWTSDRELRSVLTYVDRTTGPEGGRVSLAARRAELAVRYGESAPQLRWFDASLPDAMLGASLLSEPIE